MERIREAGLYLACLNELQLGERRCGLPSVPICRSNVGWWRLSRSPLCATDCGNESRLYCHLFTRLAVTMSATAIHGPEGDANMRMRLC